MCTALIRSIFTNMYAVIPAAAAAVQCRVSSPVEMSLANNRTDPLLYSEWRYTAMPSLGKTTVANKDGQPATHIYGHFRLHCWIIVSQIKYLLHKIHRRPAKNKVTFFSPWYACILFIHKLFSVSNQLVFDYISRYIQFLKDSSKSTKSEKICFALFSDRNQTKYSFQMIWPCVKRGPQLRAECLYFWWCFCS